MTKSRNEVQAPIRVVLFCGGPGLERAVVELVSRLEEHSEVEFLAGFCQSGGQTLRAKIHDLWTRRGVLGLAVLLADAATFLIRACSDPRSELAMRRTAARVSRRIQVVPDLHAEEVLQRVRLLKPDLGLVYGGPILQPSLFDLPERGTLGIHHGKVPEYRGKKTTFWAMYNGEPTAGITIQRLNRGIDTGDVVAEGEVIVGARSLRAVWKELEKLGIDLYVKAIVDVKRGTARPRPQAGKKGRLYRDPKAADIARFWWKQVRRSTVRKPGICMLTETYHPVIGGGETQARLLAEDLAARGVEVTVITRRSSASLKKTEQTGNITVHRIGPVGPEHFKKWALLFTAIPALIHLSSRYNLILVSGFRLLGIPAVLIGKLWRKPCILKADSNGEMSGEFFADGLKRLKLPFLPALFTSFLRLRNAILSTADGFVAISSDVARELEQAGIARTAVRSIPNAVDTTRFHPAEAEEKLALRRKLGIPMDATVAIYTGRLVSYKGLPLLLEVWRKLAGAHPNATLLLVGSGGLDTHNCEAELTEYVRLHQMGRGVCFTGDVDNVDEYLKASDIFVFPTEKEAFGISLVEAMACGLPCVATRVGGAKDVIVDHHNGILIEPGSFEQLHDALNRLITDSCLRGRLGETAAETVRQTFARETVGEQYERLFALFGPTQSKMPIAVAR